MTTKILASVKSIAIMVLGGVSSAYAMLPNPTDQNNQPIAGSVQSTATPVSTSMPTTTPRPLPVQPPNPPTQAGQLAVQTQVPPLPMPHTQPTVASSVPVTPSVVPAQVAPAQAAPTLSHQDVATAIYAYVVQGESLTPVTSSTQLRSGDVVEYHGYFSNVSTDRIRSMAVTMSIPDNMEFLGSQSPVNALASIDGSRFSRMPLRANMNGAVQDIPLNLYKGLRWEVEDVGLKGVVVAKYRARVK